MNFKRHQLSCYFFGLFLLFFSFSSISFAQSEPANASEMEAMPPIEKEAPAFSVKLRKENLNGFACANCHQYMPTDSKERTLQNSHTDVVLKHGGKRFWCLTCHNSEDRNYLRSVKNKKIDFDQSYRLCGQCHFRKQKDWFFGAHGKRIGNWRGKRVLYLCTECHNPHSPAIVPMAPNPPPKVRKGLDWIPSRPHSKLKLWETGASSSSSASKIQGSTHE